MIANEEWWWYMNMKQEQLEVFWNNVKPITQNIIIKYLKTIIGNSFSKF